MPVLTASLLHVGSEAPIACLRPSEEKLAALAFSISAERGEPPAKGPRQELYVGEIRDALMTHGPACPRCRGLDVVRYGKRGAVQRYKCKTCPCYFTDLTGSVLHRIRRRDRWLDFCLCMVEGLSVRETAKSIGICKNTAFAWRHRVIAALASADSESMCEGIVEVAQWPLIRSFKGSRPPKEADLGEMDPIVRRNPIAYRRFFPECRQAALVVRELGQYIRDSEGDILRRSGRSRNSRATAGAKQDDGQGAPSTERPFSWRNHDSRGYIAEPRQSSFHPSPRFRIYPWIYPWIHVWVYA